jgi:23S rRNA (guanosine2251-2'-O)-methyltransferase
VGIALPDVDQAAASVVAPRQPAYKPGMSHRHTQKKDHRDRRDRRGLGHHPSRSAAERRPESHFIYGIHPVFAALANPRRSVMRIVGTANALARLAEERARFPSLPEEVTPHDLDRLLGAEAVHQGIALEVAPLEPLPVESVRDARLVVVLDQVTDPHNVGAILRSALAFGADALLSTARHAPAETGVLAKAASGALDRLPLVSVPNLARALDQLADFGFYRIGLDSEGGTALEASLHGDRIALVLGAEGKGLRRLTREKCDAVARLAMAGPLASLNVSNAAAVALYVVRRHIDNTVKG